MLKTLTQSKPSLNKHTTNIYKNMHKTRKLKKNKEPKLETLPQHKNSLELDFDCSP